MKYVQIQVFNQPLWKYSNEHYLTKILLLLKRNR